MGYIFRKSVSIEANYFWHSERVDITIIKKDVKLKISVRKFDVYSLSDCLSNI